MEGPRKLKVKSAKGKVKRKNSKVDLNAHDVISLWEFSMTIEVN